jgi:glycosyltransferase involved in cell wall biosynthesis
VKILVAALNWYPDRPSGAALLASGHAVGLAERGHEVTLVAPMVLSSDREVHEAEGVRVLRYEPSRYGPLDPRRIGAHGRAVAALLSRQVPDPVDVVIGHTLLSYLPALERRAPASHAVYYVHSPVRAEYEASARHEPLTVRARLKLAGRVFHRIEHRAFEQSTVLLANSEFTRRTATSAHGRSLGERIRVVPGWVDATRFVPVESTGPVRGALGLPMDRPVLFTLRRLVPRMGLERLLEACGRLRAAGREFLLVVGGDGPLRPALEAQAQNAGLARCVRFLGRVPDELLPSWYAAADAFVLPTAELEGFGLIALEAMSAGRPVLATPVGAIPELLGRYEPSWIARDASAGGLHDLLDRFLGGGLPVRDPKELHAAVARDFGKEAVLPRLIAASLGQPDAA